MNISTKSDLFSYEAMRLLCIFELFEGATVNSVNQVSECFAHMSV